MKRVIQARKWIERVEHSLSLLITNSERKKEEEEMKKGRGSGGKEKVMTDTD